MEIKLNVRKMAELGIALTAIAALLVAGCGGGGGGGSDTTAAGGAAGTTSIPVNLNNDPLINARAQADCANGVTGQSLVGTSAVPGIGAITVSDTCQYPIKISTIKNLASDGKALMRPIGGGADVDYDSATNFAITAIADAPPAVGANIVVTPVSTMVANQALASAASTVGAGSTLGAQLAALALTGAAKTGIATAQANVINKLNLPLFDSQGKPLTAAQKLNKDYSDSEIAGASKRLAGLAIIGGANQGASAVAAGKTISQYVAEKLAAAISNIPANASSVGITSTLSNAVGISSSSAIKKVDDDAGRVAAIVTAVNNIYSASGIAAPATSADMFKAVQTQSSNPALNAYIVAQQNEAAKDDAFIAINKMVNDVVEANRTSVTLTPAQVQAKNNAAAAAVAILNTHLQSSFESLGAAPTSIQLANVTAQAKAAADTIKLAIVNDTDKVFSVPPTIGASSSVAATAAGVQAAAAALVGKVTEDVKGVTAANAGTFVPTTAATNASKVTSDLSSSFASISLPPTPGDTAALNATLSAMAAKASSVSGASVLTTVQIGNLAATINAAKASMVAAAGTLSDDPLAFDKLEEAAKQQFTTPINFGAPPAPGQLIAPPTVQTTTTTAYSPTTTLAKLTTTTTTTTAAPTTTTTRAATTTTTVAATTTTTQAVGGGTTTTTATPTTTTTVATTTTTTVPAVKFVTATTGTVGDGQGLYQTGATAAQTVTFNLTVSGVGTTARPFTANGYSGFVKVNGSTVDPTDMTSALAKNGDVIQIKIVTPALTGTPSVSSQALYTAVINFENPTTGALVAPTFFAGVCTGLISGVVSTPPSIPAGSPFPTTCP